MGMVFANRRTCIDPEYLDRIIKEDGYRPITEESELSVGDVVVYKSSGQVVHVGLVALIQPVIGEGRWEITVLSQWGRTGEYFHSLADVHANFGEQSEYWTDRP
jgi:hypothetical protein